MPSDSHSVVVLISVQAILPHCGSLLSSLVMTARRPSVAVRGQGGIDLTASGLTIVTHQALVIQINFQPAVILHCARCSAVSLNGYFPFKTNLNLKNLP